MQNTAWWCLFWDSNFVVLHPNFMFPRHFFHLHQSWNLLWRSDWLAYWLAEWVSCGKKERFTIATCLNSKFPFAYLLLCSCTPEKWETINKRRWNEDTGLLLWVLLLLFCKVLRLLIWLPVDFKLENSVLFGLIRILGALFWCRNELEHPTT